MSQLPGGMNEEDEENDQTELANMLISSDKKSVDFNSVPPLKAKNLISSSSIDEFENQNTARASKNQIVPEELKDAALLF